MDMSSLVHVAFYHGQQASDHYDYVQAYEHFTKALNFYSATGYRDPQLWSKILFERAGILMRMSHVKEGTQDINRALTACPQPCGNYDEADKWMHFATENLSDPVAALSCYAAALHFANGNNFLQSVIHGRRASVYNELREYQECDNDVRKCKMYDPETAVEEGNDWKKKGITLFDAQEFQKSIKALQLAEKFLTPLKTSHHLNEELRRDLHHCCNVLASAAWKLKQYTKALRAGEKCYQLKSVTDQREASLWRMKGNEILKAGKYDYAADCYSLAIKYAPQDDVELRGILYSNRSLAYFRKKQFREAKEDAQQCLEYRPQWSKSYHRLGSALLEMQQHDQAVNILRKGLNIPQTNDEQYQIFLKIIDVVSSCKDGPKKINFHLPPKCMGKFLKECIEKEDWDKIEFLFLGGGGQQCYPEGAGGLATGCDVSELSLSDLIKSKKKENNLQELLTVLIDHGAPVNGVSDLSPLSAAVDEKVLESALVLLKKKANANGLLQCKISKPGDTPFHTALRIGLSSGSWNIFNYLMDNYPEHFADSPNSISELTDAKGNGLFHLIASGERMSPHSIKAIDILKKHQVNPLTRNKDGQTALMMLRRKDERYRRIEEIMKSFAAHPAKKKKKNRKNKKNKDSTRHALHENSSVIENSFNSLGKPSTAPARPGEPKLQEKEELEAEHDEGPNPRPKSELEIIRDRLSVAINNLDVEIMVGHSERTETETVSSPNLLRDQVDEERPVVSCDTSHTQSPSNLLPEDKTPLSSNTVNLEDTLEEKDEFEEDSDVLFDNLTWEVECTSEVWKILNDRRLSPVTKKRIVKVIQQLANGHMRGHLAIRLEGLPKQNNILLFEAKLTKGARILWERAIAFSPRCSNNTELLSGKKEERVGRIYSDIIRIWDIVFDHETVPRKIENIVRSHKRGSSCIIKKQLKGFEVECTSSSSTKDLVCIPNLYAHKDDLEKLKKSENLSTNALPTRSNEVSTMFFPPGSPEDTEYHILKFYAFSNSLVNAVLEDRGKTNVDFPFRVSELEHAVINLKPNPMSSLLLLGRSGTGKTTCCLYRLWSNFQKYWQERSIDEPGIPRTAQFIPKNTEHNTPNDPRSCEGEDDGCYKEDVLGVVERNSFSPKSSVVLTANTKATANAEQESLCHLATCNKDSDTTDVGPTYEHLHQAFITKNAVLCTEVQKNFYDLSRACSSTRSHSEYQRPSSVNKFGQLKEEEWPFFVCSRDWLLMLDASLPEPAFFPRNDEGELLHTVKGWGEEDNHLQEIPGENSEDDDDEEYEIEPHQNKTEKDHNSRALSGMDGRREVTYQVFKNELWPKMTKKIEVQYHPTLVWTEIRSFIKGSVEALHCSHGHITLDEYQALGRKRAPNFSADREIVYELFEAYQRIKRSKGMFDEADLVYHIYHRLQGTVPEWSIHEIYVDETQDFTQAELSVIIRSCRDPNRLFFTGDTAQSIMRGIAFRFSDLKSLFYYMNQSYKAVGYEAQVHVPDRVYQLTHNYRSHAGILNLASSVINLLLHFFPESFDRMKRDQGLFHGPKPVLLESCSFSDLAVILRGHKRKTSPIEFGAHQVVLVASDEVRDSLPEELSLALVMTVYEAKGLEFDDVLIYNFFKDSQASKEWRVVGNYKTKDNANDVSGPGIAEILEDDLETKTKPLKFDPDRHKILISEFKYLYTALTRARVNVWLFDEDEEARAPMFDYFKTRGVVEVKRPHKTDDDKVSLEGMFADKSSKEEWSSQGHYFYKKGLWKVALQCFTMADDEIMKMKCHAQLQVFKASSLVNEPRKLRIEFLKAAELFLNCRMSDEAAICLHNAQARLLLAKLHEKKGNFLKAAKIFRRERKFLEASENFESGLDFMRAVDCLLQSNRYDKALKVIAKCEILRQDENELPIVSLPRLDQRDESICYQAAEYYLKRGQLDLMTSALEKLPETKDRITFLKKNGCDEQAAELLLKEGKAEEAAKLMRANGKFLEATSFTDDDKFAAECYLIAARTSVLFKENNETTVSDEETKKLIEVPLRRAYELYEKCDDLNGQAEVKFLRSKFYGNVKDLQEAGRLYYRAQNYAGLAECFLLLMDMEKDPKMFPRSIAINTVNSLLYLILALHKKNRESIDGKAISMCETHFGLVDTEDTGTRRIPRLEMVRFSHIQTEEEIKNEEIDLDEAYNVIREHLYKMASELIMQVWDKHQRINEQYKPCSRYLSDSDLCKEESCTNYHGDLTRQHFADRFYALCFLIQLDAMVDKFLKDLKRESAKVTYRLRESLPFRFKACRWLEELLFPRIGQLGQSYIITENDIRFLREGKFIRDRIIEYAKMDLWYGASEEERWSDSDLYITVSNLMHLAAAPVAEIFSLLSVEERKFEAIENSDRSRDRYGFFPDKRKVGCFEIFTKWLEHSKNALYRRCDVLSASHSAVKTFLFTPARRSSMPYPSIANAVMILEYYMTACLMLYTRLMMNGIPICLPASYLSLIKFWDIVNRSKSNQSTVCSAIQRHAAAFQVEERLPVLDRLHRLTESMVMLMFGGISKRYNIFSAALGNKSVNWGEAERTLILALTMLCNCGRGIPEPCEVLIRQQFLMLQSRDYLPYKLSQCIEAVRHSHGIFDVVNALEKLLKRKPRQEKLFDVRWNEISGREIYRNCQTDFYLRNFRFLINIDELLRDLEHNWDSRESKDARAKDDFLDDFQQNFGEEEAYNKTLEDKNDEKVRKRACLTIERAFCNWMKRKMSTVKKNKKIKSDPVELHFQNFKLDKSGCTICGNEQFEDRSLELSDTSISLQPSSPDNVEETSSNWHSRPIKRSTFISHCSRGNPHWPTEKQFKKFKAYYKSEIYPNLERARQLKVEMELLKNKTGITCSLDLDRLGQAVSRLQTEVKKVEKECAWAKDKSVGEAVGEVIKRISRIQTIKNCKENVEAEGYNRLQSSTSRMDRRNDSEEDGDDDDGYSVTNLKEIDGGVRKRRNKSRYGKRGCK